MLAAVVYMHHKYFGSGHGHLPAAESFHQINNKRGKRKCAAAGINSALVYNHFPVFQFHLRKHLLERRCSHPVCCSPFPVQQTGGSKNKRTGTHRSNLGPFFISILSKSRFFMISQFSWL